MSSGTSSVPRGDLQRTIVGVPDSMVVAVVAAVLGWKLVSLETFGGSVSTDPHEGWMEVGGRGIDGPPGHVGWVGGTAFNIPSM